MSFIEYLKERWITYTFILFAFIFFVLIYKLDKSFNIAETNANYISSLNALSDDFDEFLYPTDKEYAKLVHALATEYERYKADILNKKSEELEFITKWVHDVKVPISAVRLILENHDNDIPDGVYQNIDMELFSIEQSIQRVFYELKSDSFHDDYKIQKVSTRKLMGVLRCSDR